MRFFQFIADYIARRRIFIATFNELNAYSDRDLNDIGISRSDIGRIAAEATAQKLRKQDLGHLIDAVALDARA